MPIELPPRSPREVTVRAKPLVIEQSATRPGRFSNVDRVHPTGVGSMAIHVYARSLIGSSVIEIGESGDALWAASLVFQRPSLQVGFWGEEGMAALAPILRGAVEIERTNLPGWRRITDVADSTRRADVMLAPSLTCSGPREELRKVESGDKQRRANVVRARHGRPPGTVVQTRFDDWVRHGRRPRREAIDWLMASSDVVALWNRPVTESAPILLGRSEEEVLGRAHEAAAAAGLSLVRHHEERTLPQW